MTIQIDDLGANAMLDAWEVHVGQNPTLEIRTGPAPANALAADQGTVVATVPLPADWLGNAAGRVKSKIGTWEDQSADADGEAKHYRIKNSGGVTKLQGTVSATGGGGDMTVDNVVFKATQGFTITAWSLGMPNNA